MTKAVAWVLGIVLAVVMTVSLAIPNSGSASAQEELPIPTVTATITAPPDLIKCAPTRINPKQVSVQCLLNGIPVLNTVVDLPIPLPLPPITLPPVTVTALPTQIGTIIPTELPTRIIRLPGSTQTVRIPGPVIEVPGPTKTITRPSEPRSTVTVTASPSVSPSGQAEGSDDKVVQQPEPEEKTFFEKIPGPVRIIGLSILVVIGLTVLGMLLLWGGFILGYRSANKANAKFLESLKGAIKRPRVYRGKHM